MRISRREPRNYRCCDLGHELPIMIWRLVNHERCDLLLIDVTQACIVKRATHCALRRTTEQAGRTGRRRRHLHMAGNRAHNGGRPGFLSGALQTAAQTRAPGFATRANSRAADFTSGKNMKPNRHRTASKLASGKGNTPASHVRVSKLRRPWRAAFSAATASMRSDKSVTVTRPCGTNLAAVSPGSPVPAATSTPGSRLAD